MAEDYYTLVTATGLAKLAAAQANGGHVAFAELTVGDGDGSLPDHDETSTALVHEVHRQPINEVRNDPDNPPWVVAETIIPPDIGGWYVREVGIIDSDGDLIAVARYPETYKPVLGSGAGHELVMRLIVEISNADQVPLTLDPTVVMASRDYVDRAVRDAMPPGSIILWSGAITAIPEGWALCDGENGTPDLRDRFVVGAGSAYSIGDHGGSTHHNHGGSTNGRTLSTAQMPPHSHGQYSAINGGGYDVKSSGSGYRLARGTMDRNHYTTTGTFASGGGQSHSHPIIDDDHRPPYFALAYIMKVS